MCINIQLDDRNIAKRWKYCAKRYILHHTINIDNPELLLLSGFKRIPLKLIKDLQKLLPQP